MSPEPNANRQPFPPLFVHPRKCLGTVAYIGVHTVPEPFAWAMLQLVQFCNEYVCTEPGEYIHWDRFNKSGQILARNALTQRMQGDWILFIDSDHVPEPDLVYRLLWTFLQRKIDVLGGYYAFKEFPHQPMAWMWMPEKKGYAQVADWDRKMKLIQVGVVGGGCMLISRRAVEALVNHFGQAPFNPIDQYATDDFDFCERCRQAGIKVWWSTSIECPHLSTRPITQADYRRDQVMGEQGAVA